MEGKKVTRAELLTLLHKLANAPGEWLSVYLRPDSSGVHHARLVHEAQLDPRLVEVAKLIEDEKIQRELERYRTGLALYYSSENVIAVVPPFVVAQDSVTVGAPLVQPLRTILEHPGRTLLVLVTWGAYVVALYDGESLIRYKKGTGHIHPPHKKGGSSQARFARRTENQRSEFLRRVGGHIDEQLGQERVDHIFFGGNRLVITPLSQESRFLRDHAALLSPRTILVKRASLDTREGALMDAYSSMVFRARPLHSPAHPAEG